MTLMAMPIWLGWRVVSLNSFAGAISFFGKDDFVAFECLLSRLDALRSGRDLCDTIIPPSLVLRPLFSASSATAGSYSPEAAVAATSGVTASAGVSKATAAGVTASSGLAG